jgi:hypothetical protein
MANETASAPEEVPSANNPDFRRIEAFIRADARA